MHYHVVFINCTIDNTLTLSADKGLIFMKYLIDTQYAVHLDMCGRTGGCLTLGHGMLHSRPSKLPFLIWFNFFIESQHYKLKENELNQDNTSEIRVEKMVRCPVGNKPGSTLIFAISFFFRIE